MTYTTPIQLVLGLFLLFALSRVYLRAKSGELRLGEILFWAALFTLALVGVIEPGFTTYLAKKIGIGRGADVVTYLALAILSYMIFRTNVFLENLRQEITLLTRKMALYEQQPEKKLKK